MKIFCVNSATFLVLKFIKLLGWNLMPQHFQERWKNLHKKSSRHEEHITKNLTVFRHPSQSQYPLSTQLEKLTLDTWNVIRHIFLPGSVASTIGHFASPASASAWTRLSRFGSLQANRGGSSPLSIMETAAVMSICQWINCDRAGSKTNEVDFIVLALQSLSL